MNFNEHSYLKDRHAFLGASQNSWTNYDEEKLIAAYHRSVAAARGTELHEFASMAIRLGINLPKNNRTLNMFVNDAIGFGMNTEQPLFYSLNCFGTVDAISFKKNLLRIHDYKSGTIPASMRQLEVYAALFCLEYNQKPAQIKMKLRIYQNDNIVEHIPFPEDIINIIDKIIVFDKKIDDIKSEV